MNSQVRDIGRREEADSENLVFVLINEYDFIKSDTVVRQILSCRVDDLCPLFIFQHFAFV